MPFERMMHRMVKIDYTNYRGERSWYFVVPITMSFRSTEFHVDLQWMLEAAKMTVGADGQRVWAVRDFACLAIHEWRALTPQEWAKLTGG